MQNVIKLKFLNTNFKKWGQLGTKFQKYGPQWGFVCLGASFLKWGRLVALSEPQETSYFVELSL